MRDCPCGAGPIRVIAFITEPRVIKKILRWLATECADDRSPPGSTEHHTTAA